MFERAGLGRIEEWDAVEAPARRRRWFDSHEGTMAVLLASTSDLDDLIPTLVAYQVEWNKLHAAVRANDMPDGDDPDPAACADAFGGSAEDWIRIREAWGDLRSFLEQVRSGRLNLRIRMLGGSQAGYARMTRRWWPPVRSSDGGAGSRRPAGLLHLLQPALDRQPRHADRAGGRGGDRRLRRGARARVPARGARSASARAAPRARGRTSCTSARGCCGRRCPRTARSGGAGRRRSAPSASPTSPAAPRCACPRR